MLIDWFTVFAQIFNFLILLVLLKYLLYDRVIAAVDRREERIRRDREKAEESREKAEARMQEVREREQDLEKRRSEALREAEEAADERRQELEREAGEAVARKRSGWLDSLEREQDSLTEAMAAEAWTGSFRLAKLAVGQLAGRALGSGVVETFIHELGGLDQETLDDFSAGLDQADNRVVIATAGELPEEERKRLVDALHERTGRDLDVDWRTEERLGLGIEVKAGGRELPWSMNAWLDSLRDDVREAVSRQLESRRTRQRGDEGGSDTGEEHAD